MSDYLERILKDIKKTRSRSDGISGVLSTLTREPLVPSVGAPMAAPGALPGNLPAAPGPSAGGTGVDSWVNQALGVLGLDGSYAPGIKNMIQRESGGNPRAINNWDSNAKKGTPSKGLMQTIDSTFKAHALPGYDKDPYDPVSNIIAAVTYARKRYGDGMVKAGGRKNSAGKYIGY